MAFGATDYFSLGSAQLKLQDSDKSGAGDRDDIQDEHGDPECTNQFGNILTYRCVYDVVAPDEGETTIDIAAIVQLGDVKEAVEVGVNAVVKRVSVATGLDMVPRLTVEADEKFGAGTIEVYTLPLAPVSTKKLPQGMGALVAGASTRLNSCEVDFSVDVLHVRDEDGDYVLTADVFNGQATATCRAVKCTGDPAVTAGAGWTLAAPIGLAGSNVGHGESTANSFRGLVRDSGTSTTTTTTTTSSS